MTRRAWPLLALLAIGCGSDPDPVDQPPAEEVRSKDGAKSAKEPAKAEPTDEEKAATPTISGDGSSSARRKVTFERYVGKMHAKDVVEVELVRGGFRRGRIITLQNELLLITSGTEVGADGIEQSFKPHNVRRIALLHRPQRAPTQLKTSDDLEPPSTEESWLQPYAELAVLGKDPRELWTNRFRKNRVLVVRRPFQLLGLSLTERSDRAYYGQDKRPRVLYRKDKIKLIGSSLGYQRLKGGETRCLGEVYHYLVRRGRTTWLDSSLDRLHPGDLTKTSIRDFHKNEPTTFVIYFADDRSVVHVHRIKAWAARAYRKHLEKTPDRPAIRRLRADDEEKPLEAAEERIKKLYRSKAVGLRSDDDLDRALLLEMWIPTIVEGGVHLLPYRRQVGLD